MASRPILKVVLIGDTAVGKTCIAQRIARNTYSSHDSPTIGAAFLCVEHPGARIELWDTAGQERYKSLAPMYLRGAHVVWHVVEARSPDAAFRPWLETLRATHGRVMRVYSKSDLHPDWEAPEGRFLTSALTGAGCEELMRATVAPVEDEALGMGVPFSNINAAPAYTPPAGGYCCSDG